MHYWPEQARLIQVDINADRIGLTKPVSVAIQGDAALVADGISAQLSSDGSSNAEREALIQEKKDSWASELSGMLHEADDVGTTWNQRCREREPNRMSPRQVWQSIKKVLPTEAIISTDIGNNCAIG